MQRILFDRHPMMSRDLECVKTGCDVFIEPYDQWAHGDAFMAGGFLILRLAGVSDKPMSPVRHFTVTNADQWFDRKTTSMAQNSTLVVPDRHFVPHGYDGLPESGFDLSDGA